MPLWIDAAGAYKLAGRSAVGAAGLGFWSGADSGTCRMSKPPGADQIAQRAASFPKDSAALQSHRPGYRRLPRAGRAAASLGAGLARGRGGEPGRDAACSGPGRRRLRPAGRRHLGRGPWRLPCRPGERARGDRRRGQGVGNDGAGRGPGRAGLAARPAAARLPAAPGLHQPEPGLHRPALLGGRPLGQRSLGRRPIAAPTAVPGPARASWSTRAGRPALPA